MDGLGVLGMVQDMAQGNGMPMPIENVLTLGDSLPVDGPAPPEEEGTYQGQPQPSSAKATEVPIEGEERQALARELAEKLGLYRNSMRGVWERWEEIEDAYNLRPGGGSRTGDGEQFSAPLLMTLVDQAEARLEGGILEAEPLCRVRPIDGISAEQITKEKESGSAERFYNNYLKTKVRISRRLVPALRRMPKLGTAVLRWDWKDESILRRFYTEGGDLKEERRQESKLDFSMVENHEVVLWPLDVVDWQDAEIAGHWAHYSKAGWWRKAAELGVSEEDRDRIWNRGIAPPPERNAQAERQGADPASVETMEGIVTLTELWCNLILPGGTEPERFVVILHEETPEILRITWNTHHAQAHPYFPLRYKILDGWAWGQGIGHEVIANQAIASALKTLKLDNIAAGAYNINLVRTGSLAHTLTDRLRPGEKLPVEKVSGPDADFHSVKMGGDAPEVYQAESQNDYEARAASGLPDVLQGQADQTLKSGGSTGQTLALIEQASVKFNSTGRTVKDDLGDFLRGGFEHLCQYAPDGVVTRYADSEDALIVKSLRWTPPRGRSIAEAFAIWVEAPSMATSNESRKERGLVLSGFMGQQLQLLHPLAQQILSVENPAALQRYARTVYDFFEELTRRIIRYHDFPGVEQLFPSLPEPIPGDELMNQLQQALTEAQGQVEQLAAENQQLLANIQQGLHHEQPEGMPS